MRTFTGWKALAVYVAAYAATAVYAPVHALLYEVLEGTGFGATLVIAHYTGAYDFVVGLYHFIG